MGLDQSVVHRNLDSQIRFLGMELFDVLGLGVFASTMNIIFGQTSLAGIMVFGLPGVLLAVVYFGKKGKPDRFLQDFIRFSILPGVFFAGKKLEKEKERVKEIVTKS